jgi:peptidoglycan hydrolase-like protein with peptidoglycan-binding domain
MGRSQGIRATAIAMAIGAIVFAGCGGDAEETTTSSTATTTTTAATTSTTSTTLATTTTTTVPRPGATDTTYVVQADLTALGYFEGAIDGIAGEETRAAIASFQNDAGIEADGAFGPVTDAAMVPRLQQDAPYVENLQEALTELEFYTGPIDGDFGQGTRAAVERLQASCELEETGEIDIDTRLCIFAP